MARSAARVDNNQDDIVESLLTIPGVSVEKGHDDILVGFRGDTYWYEIKSARAVSRRSGKVLKSQVRKTQNRLKSEFMGHYKIVTCLEDILIDMEIMKDEKRTMPKRE